MRQLSVSAPVVQKDPGETYEEAVETLNTLQSNAAYIEKARLNRDKRQHLSLPETLNIAKRVGITLEEIDGLSVIHISGTKGKGSTCALCESILRAHGYKTAFFSSPHLVEVRERMRINGRPISRHDFSTYFWQCYSKLESSKADYDGEMPPYFRFLTVMALHVFIKEKVDVAILEVGIGGEYDCTNIVKNPVVCGVSSLGIDHTTLLGSTLDKIAWHKGGIFKPGTPAVTVDQPTECMDVLLDRAYDIGCPLYQALPSVYDNDWTGHQMAVGIPGCNQDVNASLAVQVCHLWLQNHDHDLTTRQDKYRPYLDKSLPKIDYLRSVSMEALPDTFIKGLSECYWPGRCQILKRPQVTYFIDGAHTVRSIQSCAQWFNEASRKINKTISGRIMTVLLFNATGDRQPECLLEQLLGCGIDTAVFSPNIASISNKADQTNYMVSNKMQLTKCRQGQAAWHKLCEGSVDKLPPSTNLTDKHITNGVDSSHIPNGEGDIGNAVSCSSHAITFNSILESLHWITQGKDTDLPKCPVIVAEAKLLQQADHIHILCTGSLHLVGGLLGLLDPDICDK